MFEFMKKSFSKEDAAKLLRTNPEALEEFEKAYRTASMEEIEQSDNLFDINSRMATENVKPEKEQEETISRIVDELLNKNAEPVTMKDIMALPAEKRPQLTGSLMKKDICEPGYLIVLDYYKRFCNEKNKKKAKLFYDHFRQGLDILDLDPVMYEIIGMNKNSIGYWFPPLKESASLQTFFKIPETKIVKVPLTLLQLTRNDYGSLNPSTLDIVNRWAHEAFELDENKTYFIKTGTYSSKFDFRNAKVTTPKEVKEIGSYLLFIHYQALQMASPLSNPVIYGVSTTNEWCVREYIEDMENNPCIYHGLPLHTEYRVFIDCDDCRVIGISPYWKPDVMKNRFVHGSDAETADKKHDWIIYSAHENVLMGRYEKNKSMVVKEIEKMLPDIKNASCGGLTGQWSLDVMQNGDDFWLIDMAEAGNSALNECIPKGMLKNKREEWIPKLK